MLVRAAGGVLWRPGADGPEVAVVHRPRYDDWSLPKGKLERGEHPLEAAVREVEEETGSRAVAGRGLGSTAYQVLVDGVLADKTVQWWSLRCRDGSFVAGDEVDALHWLPPPEARALLTAGREAEALDLFEAAPPELDLLVLVRHASAGRRKDWDGDDAERPLDDAGHRQADRLADLLPLLGVGRLVSAPPLRCTATLEPLALRLGLPVEVEPLLADPEVTRRPDEAEALLRALPPGTAVCGQGEGLSTLLGRLGADAGAPLRKGSARVLACTGGRLVADDVLDPDER